MSVCTPSSTGWCYAHRARAHFVAVEFKVKISSIYKIKPALRKNVGRLFYDFS